MFRDKRIHFSGLCITLVLLTGCSSNIASPAGLETPSPTRSSGPAYAAPATNPSASPTSLPLPAGGSDVHNQETHVDGEEEAEVVPVWDAASRQSAIATAAKSMASFVGNHDWAPAWWASFSPNLNPTAYEAYKTVIPTNIAATAVTGEPAIVDESSPYLAGLHVQTNSGVYSILLQRDDATSQWFVERLEAVPAP